MTGEIPRTLLWIDDDIAHLSAFVEALRDRGFDVATAQNADEAFAAFLELDPLVVLADIRMPPPNGIEIVRRMHEKRQDKVYAVLSSFLYLQRYRDELACLRFPVQLISKNIPNVQDDAFEELFVQPIASLFDEGVTYSVADSHKPHPAIEGVDPFKIEFAEFMALPITEKDRLTDRAEELAHKAIERSFEGGRVWVLLCGDRDETVASVDRFERIPEERDILEQAERRNRAPYQFSVALQSEDYWTECSTIESSRDYPTVSIELKGSWLDLHFDTGNPTSAFSYEEFVAKGFILPASQFIKVRRAGFAASRCVIVKDLAALIKSQKTGETKEVRLNGRAVREWVASSYSRTCKEECPRDGSHSSGELCPLRWALVGRNLLTDNDIALTLDGASKSTYFGGE